MVFQMFTAVGHVDCTSFTPIGSMGNTFIDNASKEYIDTDNNNDDDKKNVNVLESETQMNQNKKVKK